MDSLAAKCHAIIRHVRTLAITVLNEPTRMVRVLADWVQINCKIFDYYQRKTGQYANWFNFSKDSPLTHAILGYIYFLFCSELGRNPWVKWRTNNQGCVTLLWSVYWCCSEIHLLSQCTPMIFTSSLCLTYSTTRQQHREAESNVVKHIPPETTPDSLTSRKQNRIH